MKSESIKKSHGSYWNNILGLFLSLALTFGAYFLVERHVLTGGVLDFAVIALCVVQVIVQLLFFLHLGEETKPYWNTIAFLFMLMVIVILIVGTLWIMYNLDYRLMTEK